MMNKTAYICGTTISFEIPEKEYGIDSTVEYKNQKYFTVGENWFSVMLYKYPHTIYLQHCEQGLLLNRLLFNIR